MGKKVKINVAEVPGTRLLRTIRSHFPAVHKVVDAKEGVKVTVTRGDVAWSEKRNGNACVMAKACERSLHVDGALVNRTRAFLIRGNTALRYGLTQRTQREIVAFDRGGQFMPGDYYLTRLIGSEAIGAKRTQTKKRGNLKTRRRHWLVTEGIRALRGANS